MLIFMGPGTPISFSACLRWKEREASGARAAAEVRPPKERLAYRNYPGLDGRIAPTRRDGRLRKDPRLRGRCRSQAHADLSRSELHRRGNERRGRAAGKGRVS